MVRQGPELPLQRLPPLLPLQFLLRPGPWSRRLRAGRSRRLRPAAASSSREWGASPSCRRFRFRSRSMQALDARRYSQVEKLLSPWNEANPRQALRNASWAASWASSRSPVIRRHRV